MQRLTYIFVFLISLLIASSCIKEDLNLDNCKVRVKVLFSYLGDNNTEEFLQRHDKVNLYVFDQNEGLVEELHFLKPDLVKLQGAYLNLLPGNYTIVCLGNLEGNVKSFEKKSLKTAAIQHLDDITEPDFKTPIDYIYHGIHILNVPKTETLVKDTLIQDIVPFTRAYNTIEIVIKNITHVLPSVSRATDIAVVMENLPEITPFNNSVTVKIITEGTCKYYPTLQAQEAAGVNHLSTEFRSMRFDNKNDVTLKIHTTSNSPVPLKALTANIVYSLRIEDFLKNNNIDTESYNDVDIPILIDFTNAQIVNNNVINVSVKPWVGIPLEPIQ